MKFGTTTPVSTLTTKRASLVTLAVMMAVAMPLSMAPKTNAESIAQINSKIDALQRQQDAYQSKANKLAHKADTLANKIAELQAKERKLQAQIDLSQAKYEKLQKQIAETKKQIKENQHALSETAVDMYIAGDATPLEMLASSKNIGDFIDQQAYQSSVSAQLSAKIDHITKLKKELEDQKQEVKLTLLNQKKARDNLEDTRAEQQSLLHETKGQESSYKKMIKKNQAQQDELSAKAAAMMRATIQSGAANVVSVGGSGGNYPYNCHVTLQWWNGAIVPVSPWVDDGNYGCSQCVSYAAWMMGQKTGKYPSGWGDAYMFRNTAASSSGYAAGFRVTSTPRINSVVYFPPGVNGAGSVGHVGWVIGKSGNMVRVSQYNYNFTGDPNGWGKHSVVDFPNLPGMQYIYVAGQ